MKNDKTPSDDGTLCHMCPQHLKGDGGGTGVAQAPGNRLAFQFFMKVQAAQDRTKQIQAGSEQTDKRFKQIENQRDNTTEKEGTAFLLLCIENQAWCFA